MSDRNTTLDIVRALCAIWIIVLYHLNGYYSDAFRFSGGSEIISKMLTIIALSGFTFISGFCLSKYSFKNVKDLTVFIRKD